MAGSEVTVAESVAAVPGYAVTVPGNVVTVPRHVVTVARICSVRGLVRGGRAPARVFIQKKHDQKNNDQT